MTLKELIERAIEIAGGGISEKVAEPLLPSVFAEVGQKMAAQERTRTFLRRTQVLAFTAAPVTLANDVLTDYLDEGTLIDPTDLSKQYSLAPWDQFVSRQLDQRLGHFAVEGEMTLHVVEPGFVYDPTLEPTVTLQLTTPCDPVIPALFNSQVLVIDAVIPELINTLAVALKIAVKA